MNLEGRKRLLLFEESSGLFPCFFSLVGFVDHILVDGYFFFVEERLELLIDEIDIEGWVLSGNIDVLYHISLVAHFLLRFLFRIILNISSYPALIA